MCRPPSTRKHMHTHTQSCFVDQVWKKESLLSLWDSHTCCTGLHTIQKHIFIHRNRENVSNTHNDIHPSTHIEHRHTNTQWNTDEQMGPQTISLTPLHSFNLSVITTDVFLSWFNFTDTKTKSATFCSVLTIKTMKKMTPKRRSLMLWLTYGIKASAAVIWAVETEPCKSN